MDGLFEFPFSWFRVVEPDNRLQAKWDWEHEVVANSSELWLSERPRVMKDLYTQTLHNTCHEKAGPVDASWHLLRFASTWIPSQWTHTTSIYLHLSPSSSTPHLHLLLIASEPTAAPQKTMKAASNHRVGRAMMACRHLLLLAFLLVESSNAIHTSLTSVVSSIRHAPSTIFADNDGNDDVISLQPFSGVAFVHRARRASESSCKSVNVCNHDGSPMQTINQANNNNSPLDSVLSIRGGASSSSNNAVQSIMKSILASSLPSPIKQIIEMICQFIENLTGFKLLPEPEQKKQKKLKTTTI